MGQPAGRAVVRLIIGRDRRRRLYGTPPVVDDASVRGSYDVWHDEREQAHEDHPLTAAWQVATLRNLPDVRGMRVLDIGCGRGVFARELAERGADLVAADLSQTAIRYAEARLRGLDVETLVADIHAIPFADESFDLVVSQETLAHVRQPDRALAELVRVTRRGGTLIVTGPNYLNLVGLYRIALRLIGRRYTELGQPINKPLLLARQVRKLRRLGCEIVVVEGDVLPVPIPRYDVVMLPARPHRVMRWFAFNTLIRARRA